MVDLQTSYKLKIDSQLNEIDLQTGLYIVIINASKVPPHIGLIIDNKYHSLNIKGRDINKPIDIVLKTLNQKNITSLFIKIKQQHKINAEGLSVNFINQLNRFTSVEAGGATCFSPIKLFFEEEYSVPMEDVTYFYEMIPKLYSMSLIENISSLLIDSKEFQLPVYNKEQLYSGIQQTIKTYKEN